MFGGLYSNKRVLLTGHTGFKGSWLSLWLKDLGAEVTGCSLPALPAPNLYDVLGRDTFVAEHFVDVGEADAFDKVIRAARPEIVFHLAAQPLVRESYAQPVATLDTNLMGTVHLLESIRRLDYPVTTLIVTTDKCYENVGWDHGYRETDMLGGHDIYSMSKAVCEMAVSAWRRSFFIPGKLGPIATARAGNVIGGGDYATDRIVPDCIRSLADNRPILVRNPAATRPWQHVLDCLSGYLWLAANLHDKDNHSPLASAFNFGPSLQANRTVKDLVEEVLKHWRGHWTDQSIPGAVHEASRLHLSIDKASTRLGWFPTWDFSATVAETIQWYHQRHLHGETGLRETTVKQIRKFAADARAAAQPWATTTAI